MDNRIGVILQENPLMDSNGLERCLQIQKLGGNRKPIGQILIEENVVSEQTLDRILAIQKKRRAQLKRKEAPEIQHDLSAPTIDALIERARERQATDLLLGQGRQPWVRVRSQIEEISNARLDQGWMEVFLHSFLTTEQREDLYDSRFVIAQLQRTAMESLRATVFLDSLGPTVSIRLHSQNAPTFESLGLRGIDLLARRRGMILVAGGARSGKSTTLAAVVTYLAQTFKGHIIVLDERQEFRYPQTDSLITCRKVGCDTKNLESALRSAMREDPDIIVIGDLFGPASVELAIQAVATGRMVVAGVRASGTLAAVKKLLDGVPDQFLPYYRSNLAAVLEGALGQDLVPERNGKGQVVAQETLIVGNEVRHAIAEGNFDQVPIILGLTSDQGSRTLDHHLAELVQVGRISIEDAFARARDKQKVLIATGGARGGQDD